MHSRLSAIQQIENHRATLRAEIDALALVGDTPDLDAALEAFEQFAHEQVLALHHVNEWLGALEDRGLAPPNGHLSALRRHLDDADHGKLP